MILCDVNVYLYAFRRDSDRHAQFKAWLEKVLKEEPVVGVSEMVLSAVVRIATHPRIYARPSKLEEVLVFTQLLLDQSNVVSVMPGARHWSIFVDLCRKVEAKGNLIADAYLAALTIESGSEWITTDRDFARFPGLRWRHPLDADRGAYKGGT